MNSNYRSLCYLGPTDNVPYCPLRPLFRQYPNPPFQSVEESFEGPEDFIFKLNDANNLFERSDDRLFNDQENDFDIYDNISKSNVVYINYNRMKSVSK